MNATPIIPLYADAVRGGGLLFTSGHIPVDDDGRTPDTITAQTHLAIDNLEATLHRRGSAMSDLIQVTVFLLDIHDDFDAYNAVYRERVLPHATPARTTVQVAQFRGPKRIELHAVATCPASHIGPPTPPNKQ